GSDVGWTVYFPPSMPLEAASQYERPFAAVYAKVFPKYGEKRKRWWIHERPRPELQSLVSGLGRYLATVKHSKFRIFAWIPSVQLVSNAIEAFANDSDEFFGLLQS